MPDQVLEGLKCESGKLYVDCTLGGGGHSFLIANAIGPEGRLISLDVDQDAINEASLKLKDFKNVTIINSNYLKLPSVLSELNINKVDGGILMDLGVSTHQLTSETRGFSFSSESRLDMRMDKSLPVSAFDLVNDLSASELAEIFFNYGEERYSRRIASAIKDFTVNKPLETTKELADLVKSVVPYNKKSKIHPATRIFQALRIKVNNELEILNVFLESIIDLLQPGARLVVITFHSLEDRIVKRFFKHWSLDCVCSPKLAQCNCGHVRKLKIINKKPIISDIDELNINPSARSAKLRIAERVL